jgi:pilus assembly protein CpaE
MTLLDTKAASDKALKAAAGRVPLLAFLSDAESEAILHDCLAQLSLANGLTMRGGIGKAIQYLTNERSPHILIVDVSGVELPVSEVESLAEVCEPGVTVIVIGERNDIGLYRDLQLAGVTDYIVKPVTPYLLGKALQFASDGRQGRRISHKLAKMVAFAGARGGVGTTTLAVNMAWYLANCQNRRVALLDLDLHHGDSNLMLNIKPTAGLREALENPLRVDGVFLERTMTAVGERLFVLSAEEPLKDELHVTPEAIDALVSVLRSQFHYIIVDVPRQMTAAFHRVLDIADLRVLVADQTLRSVRDAGRLCLALGDNDTKHRNMLVVNRAGEGRNQTVTLTEMADALEMRPKSVIAYQPKFFASAMTHARIPVAERGGFVESIASLALELSGRTPERRRWWRLSK